MIQSRLRTACFALIATIVQVLARSAHAAEGTPEEPPATESHTESEPVSAARDTDERAPAQREEPAEQKPIALPDSGGDIVETIDVDGSSAPAQSRPAPAAAAPPSPDRFEFHGWARQSVELGFSNDASHEAEPDGTSLPYDPLVLRSQLFLRARYSRARWFEADVSGSLAYTFSEQVPDRRATVFNGVNGQSRRGVLEPRLHELFVGFFGQNFDLRIGQQRVAWGKGEFSSPNDVLNARDLRDPFVGETEMRVIPTFMLRADLDLGFATLEGIVSPVYTPDRFDVYGSNWAALQPESPVWARGVANIIRRSIDPTLQEPAQPLLMATSYPKSDLTEPVLAARFSWSVGSVDLNYYYQYGFDGPLIAIDPALGASLASIDFTQAGLVDLEPWIAAIDAGQEPLRATYVRRHHAGVDIATTLGRIALRLDAAYQSKRVFFRRDLVGVVSPSIQGVLGIEYQTGDIDKLVLLEGIYLRVLDAPSAPLLIYEQDTGGAALDLRWPIWGPFSVEVRAMLGIQPQMAIVQPALNLKVDPVVVSLGGLWLDGDPYSLADYFARNREVYAKAKVFF